MDHQHKQTSDYDEVDVNNEDPRDWTVSVADVRTRGKFRYAGRNHVEVVARSVKWGQCEASGYLGSITSC